MAAHEKLSNIQFNYERMGREHLIQAFGGPTGTSLGHMRWSSNQIRNIMVASDQQRRGVATAMWNEGQRLASENARIPKPKHSGDRTTAGDAWARSVGGRLPRRRQ